MKELTRKEFIAEARDCVGTPYVAGQSKKRYGCDCVGLLIHLAREFGIPFRTEPYLQSPKGDSLLVELDKYLDRVDLEALLPGDILVFWVKSPKVPTHVGILDEDGYLIHASSSHGVVRVGLAGRWGSRLAGAYQVRGIK